MKKTGFTLIELLAVIAILAIIVIIAVPSIIRMFNDAKMKAFKLETQNIVKAGEQGYASSVVRGNVEDTTYTYENGVENVSGNIVVRLSGRKIKNGQISIMSTGEVAVAIHDGEYCASKGYDKKEVVVEAIPSTECEIEIIPEPTDVACFIFEDHGDSVEIIVYNYENTECPRDVVIPSKIDGVPVTVIGEMAFYNEEDLITSIIIPNSVAEIGYGAFALNLFTDVKIPNSVVTIGDYAFYATSITSVTIGNNVTTIGEYAFSESQLISVEIPDSVETIGYYAFLTAQLENLTLGKSVTSIGRSAFAYNYITGVLIPNSVVTINHWAFERNQMSGADARIDNHPGEVVIEEKAFDKNGPSSDTEITPTYLRPAFTSYNCFVFSNGVITNYVGAPPVCTSDVVIPPRIFVVFENVPVTSIAENAFSNKSLTSVWIPSGVTSIGERAFYYNSIPQGEARINNYDGSVTIGAEAFANNAPNWNTEIFPVYLKN